MKKLFLSIALVCLAAFNAQATDEVYTVFNPSNGYLDYQYDGARAIHEGGSLIVELYDPSSSTTRFNGYADLVTRVRINPNMYQAPLTSFKNMFFGGGTNTLSACTVFDGLRYLNTANVTNMRAMFYGCSAIDTLVLTSFNTANVTNMDYMFNDCTNLKCLDLSSFDMSSVTSVYMMFYDDTHLRTIYCSADLSSMSTVISSDYMFRGCVQLKGYQGTSYKSANPQNKTYAHLDGGAANPGYFSKTPAELDRDSLIMAANNIYLIAPYFAEYDAEYQSQLGTALAAAAAVRDNPSATPAQLAAAKVAAQTTFAQAKSYYLQCVAAQAKAELTALITSGDSEACYTIINNAKAAADGFIWDDALSVTSNVSDIYVQRVSLVALAKYDLNQQRISDGRAMLAAIKGELSVLEMYAYNKDYTEVRAEIVGYKQQIQTVLENTSATLQEITDAIAAARTNFMTAIVNLVATAKAAVKESVESLLPANPNADQLQIAADAKAEVDAWQVDLTKDSQANLDNFDATFSYDWFMGVKAAIEGATGLEEVLANPELKDGKIVHDGQVHILRDGKLYNVAGELQR